MRAPSLLLPPPLLLALCAFLLSPGSAARPNIILYLADDLGYGEVNQQAPMYGFPSNALRSSRPVARPKDPLRTIRTPHLARFASQGQRAFFSYAPSSLCTPSRAAILLSRQVGTNPIRANSQIRGLNQDITELVFPSVLRNAGYHTALVGKWGLGSHAGAPWNHGFDLFHGQLEHEEAWNQFPSHLTFFQRAPFSNSTPADLGSVTVPLPLNTVPGAWPSERECADRPGNCTSAIDEFRATALAFVLQHNRTNAPPFFLMWCTTAPHAGTYMPDGGAKNLTSPTRRLGDRARTMDECLRGHASQVEQHVDQDVGALLDVLEASPLLDGNTLVVFTSDNGPHKDCALPRDKILPAVFIGAGGLKGIKRTMWEGGFRVPTMVRWSSRVLANSTLRAPHTLADLGRSFIHLAGASDPLPVLGPRGKPAGSTSIADLWLKGDGGAAERPWMHMELCAKNYDATCSTATYNLTQRGDETRMVKLIVLNSGEALLYELVSDPWETSNLARTRKPLLAQMLALRDQVREPLCPPSSASTLCPPLSAAACVQQENCVWCGATCIPGNVQAACLPGGKAIWAKCS